MATARDLIKRSLLLIGVVGQGEDVEASEANDALSALNDMLDSWSADSRAVYEESRESFTLTGASSYTIGSGGDFDTTRPIRIESAFVRSGETDYPLRLVDKKQYARISQKSLSSSYPNYLYYDADYPLGNIVLWPKPISGYTLHLYSLKPLSNIADLDTAISLPPGFSRAIRYNLACEVSPEYGIEPPLKVQRIADESKEIIDAANEMNDFELLTVDDALLREESFDIYGGGY